MVLLFQAWPTACLVVCFLAACFGLFIFIFVRLDPDGSVWREIAKTTWGRLYFCARTIRQRPTLDSIVNAPPEIAGATMGLEFLSFSFARGPWRRRWSQMFMATNVAHHHGIAPYHGKRWLRNQYLVGAFMPSCKTPSSRAPAWGPSSATAPSRPWMKHPPTIL